MFGIIYRATNTTNGKQYVGQTTHTLKLRWQYHLYSAKSHSSYSLHRAIRKYGAEAFIVEQIDFAESLEELNEKEVQYILQLSTLAPGGYNLTTGGESFIRSEETCQKISKTKTGHTVSEETRQKISETLSQVCCKRGHPFDDVNTYIIPSTGGRRCLTCYYMWRSHVFPARLQPYVLNSVSA